MTGTGQRHVREAQVLVHALDTCPFRALVGRRLVRPVLAAGDVEGPPTGVRSVVQHRPARFAPEGRTAHDRELEPLRDPDRHDLHCPLVGLHPTGKDVLVGLGADGVEAVVVEHCEQPGHTGPTVGVRRDQQLCDVVEVGDLAVAVGGAQRPGRDRRRAPDVLHERADSFLGERLGEGAEPLLEHGNRLVVELIDLGGTEPAEPRQRERPRPGRIRGPNQRVQQPAPLGRRLGVEHGAAAGQHRRHPLREQRGVHLVRVLGGPDQDRDIRRSDRPSAAVAVAVVVVVVGQGGADEQLADLPCEVVEDGSTGCLDGHVRIGLRCRGPLQIGPEGESDGERRQR